ncbi:MAG TPA: hypothetical protein VNN73_21120 [Blastocatellia bacterium]|nr:hypothetical protein [Blastocatellia bacterium]
MKRFVISTILGLVLAFGAIGVSAQEISQKIVITRDSKLGGEPILKGEYIIKFEEGKDGELTLAKGNREVLKTTYKLAKLEKRAADNSVIFTLNADGSYRLKRIEFKGKDTALVFTDAIAKSISK